MTLVEFVPPTPHPLWKLCLQMGITDVIVKVNPSLTGLPDPWRFATLSQIVEKLRVEGLRVVGLEGDPFDMTPVKQFGEEGTGNREQGTEKREETLAHYRELLESMAKLDIHLLCYNFMVGPGWSRTGVRSVRGGALATYFNKAEYETAYAKTLQTSQTSQTSQTLRLTKSQVWSNYEYFLKAVMPTAEKVGVRMGLHPDDPCLPDLGGYARIFETVADYDRAYSIYPSPSNAVTFCQANFKLMGADLVETAKHFAKRIAFIHVRDVEGDKTDFTELFHDQGTTDQFALMRTYRELGLDVPVRGDHVPEMEGDRKLVENAVPGYFNLGRLFANGYLKALLRGTALGLVAGLFATPVFAEKLPPLPDGAFTYVVIPDTQRYHGEGAHIKKGRKPHVPITGPTRNPAFESRVEWTVKNLEKERIFFVSHTGDIVDFKNDQQWSFASNLMTRFEWKVPYGISPGNHDLANFSSDDFNRYFPRSRYEGRPWYAGGFDGYERDVGGKRKRVSWGNADSCQLAEIDGHKFVFFHLECNAPAPVLKWVDMMLERYADRTAVVCTHMFVGYRTRELDKVRRTDPSRPDGWFGVMDWTKCHGEEGVSGTEAWRTCFSKHANLLLVVSGDQGPAVCWRATLTGENGNVVHATLQDYPRTRDDEDWIRLYRFLPKENRIDVWTYSPRRDEVCHDSDFRKGREYHVFSLPIDFQRCGTVSE